MISANSRMKKSIMFGATTSSSGPEPRYAPTAAVSIDRASRLYTFLIKTSLSVVETDAAAVTPRASVVVVPNLIIISNFSCECLTKNTEIFPNIRIDPSLYKKTYKK